MKAGLVLAGMAFAVSVAVIVGNRLSDEAMAVVVGAVCGISASIPVSLALVIAASKNWGREEGPREIGYDYESRRYAAERPQPPQILVVSPAQAGQTTFPYPNAAYYSPPIIDQPQVGSREFKIVGGE